MTVIAGLIVSYLFLALIVSAIAGRSQDRRTKRARFAWNRSLRDEEYHVERGHPLENAFVVAAILVAVVITIWFFFFGNPGVPITTPDALLRGVFSGERRKYAAMSALTGRNGADGR